MRATLFSFLATVAQAQFVPSPGNFPATGDDSVAGGIFSISLADVVPFFTKYPSTATGSESPKTAGGVTAGSGPYPAQMTTDTTLPGHTIYAPKSPPTGNFSMPFLAWSEGGCATDGSAFRNLLTEIASHGYVIAAQGPPGGNGGAQSKVADNRASIDWAFKGGAAKYGNVDTTRVATSGQSCGGLEAMSTAYHDTRVKLILSFNMGIFQDNRRYLLQELKVPISYFLGGPKDMGYWNAEKDYPLLNAGLPSLKISLDTGHQGTYSATNGGKFGKAAVAYLEWQFRNNTTSKSIFLDAKAPGSLVSDNWNVTYKNWS